MTYSDSDSDNIDQSSNTKNNNKKDEDYEIISESDQEDIPYETDPNDEDYIPSECSEEQEYSFNETESYDADYIPSESESNLDSLSDTELYNNRIKYTKKNNKNTPVFIFPFELPPFSEIANPPPKRKNIDNKVDKELKKRRRIIDNLINNKDDNLKLEDKIILSNIPINNQIELINKLRDNSSDGDKLKGYINTILKIPFSIIKNPFEQTNKLDFPLKCKDILDKHVYGHNTIKEKIFDYISILLKNPGNKNGTILALQGPPGTGKTRILRSLSSALDLPLFQISFGGLRDPHFLLGHDYTYVGSRPGKIADILIQAKCMNPIIYLDEIDKINTDSSNYNEIYGSLLHILDEEQNSNFTDHYLNSVNLDLSNILFVVSFNNIENIDPILLNRMKVIKIPSLTLIDKIEITKNYIIPEICKKINMNIENILFDDEIIKYIIRYKTNDEDGMRNIKKNIENILFRLNTILLLIEYKQDINSDAYKNFSYKKIYNYINDNAITKNCINIDKKIVDLILEDNNKSSVLPDHIQFMYS